MKYIKKALISIMLLLLMTPAAGAAGVSQNEEAASEEWKASFFLPPDGREMIRLKHGAESSLYDDYTPMIDYLEKYNAELDFSKAWIGTMSGNNFANYGHLAEYFDAYKEIYDYEGRDEKIEINLDMFMNYDGIPIKSLYHNDHNRNFIVPAYSDGECVALFLFNDAYPRMPGEKPDKEQPPSPVPSYIYFYEAYPVSGEPSLWSNVAEAYDAVKELGADIQGIYTVSDTYYSCPDAFGRGYTLYYTPEYTDADGKKRSMLPPGGISVYDYDSIPVFDVITLKTDQGIYIYRVPKDEYWANIPETHQLFTLEEYIYHLEFEHRFLNLIIQPSASPTDENTPEATLEPSPSPERTPRTPRPTRTFKSSASPAVSPSCLQTAFCSSSASPASEPKQSSIALMAVTAVLSCAIAGIAAWAVHRRIKRGKN